MDATVARITGQDNLLLGMLNSLTADPCVLIKLCGPTGSGKSEVAAAVAEHRRTAGDVVLVAAGDPLFTRRSYFPIHHTVRPEVARQQRAVLKKAVVEAASAVPFAAKALRELFAYVVDREDVATRGQTPFLDEVERDLLRRLQSLAGTRRVLLVCEDFQWWDRASVELLSLMRSGVADSAFPFLKNLSILTVVTAPGNVAEPEATNAMYEAFKPTEFSTSYCDRARFSDLLRAFGLRVNLDSAVEAELYGICGGHLELARRLCEDAIPELGPGLAVGGISRSKLLGLAVAQRLERVNKSNSTTGELLARAAIIGIKFSDAELSCLTESRDARLRTAIDEALALRLIRETGPKWQFSHDLVREFFFDQASSSHRELNEKFAECLRVMHPGDYGRRADHLARSGDSGAAADFLVMEHLLDLRHGRRRVSEHLTGEDRENGSYVKSMFAAWHHFVAGEYSEALRKLDGIEEIHADVLLAERDILAARCHIKLLGIVNRQQAVVLLSRLTACISHEPELWGRAMLYKLVALVYIGEYKEAQAAESELVRSAHRRSIADSDALNIVNHCRLKANLLHTSDVAQARLVSSLEFFGPGDDGLVRDPVHYYIGLVNLAANRLCSGDFEGALRNCVEAKQSALNFKGHDLPRLDMLANNFVIAAYLSKKLDGRKAVEALVSLRHIVPRSNDHPLIVANQAALLCDLGDFDEAIRLAEPALIDLDTVDDADGYYVYYVANCLAGAYYMAEDELKARECWATATSRLEELAGPAGPYLRRRHTLLNSLFATKRAPWGTFLFENHGPQVGPGWSLYGRGFLLSELEFWSDE